MQAHVYVGTASNVHRIQSQLILLYKVVSTLAVNHVLSCRNMERMVTANRPRWNSKLCQAKRVFITFLTFAGETPDVNGSQNTQTVNFYAVSSAYSCLAPLPFKSLSFP
jgi:hypothetical protein